MQDSSITLNFENANVVQSTNKSSDVTYNNYYQYYLNLDMDTVVNKSFQLPWSISGSTDITYTNDTSYPIPSWIQLDLATRTMLINTTGVTTNANSTIRLNIEVNGDFYNYTKTLIFRYFSFQYFKFLFVVLIKITIFSVFQWLVQNCNKWVANITDSWSLWESGYQLVDSGKLIIECFLIW